jgi:hypothetical protein
MAWVVGVHGIAQELKGPQRLHQEWWPALSDGVGFAGGSLPPEQFECAFYGKAFRRKGEFRAAGTTHFRESDVREEDAELLALWWQEAARVDPIVVAPDAEDLRARTPQSVQTGLRVMARSRFFSGMTASLFIGALKQVTRYLREEDVRDTAQASVDKVVTVDTRVIIGHSLGSIVAYEALHRFRGQPNWANVTTFVTLGSPLGVPNVIFERLVPEPAKGRGVMPPVDRWSNISDDGDVVALVKRLGPLFGEGIVDISVHNGASAHDVGPYMSAAETGAAVAAGLARGTTT